MMDPKGGFVGCEAGDGRSLLGETRKTTPLWPFFGPGRGLGVENDLEGKILGAAEEFS